MIVRTGIGGLQRDGLAQRSDGSRGVSLQKERFAEIVEGVAVGGGEFGSAAKRRNCVLPATSFKQAVSVLIQDLGILGAVPAVDGADCGSRFGRSGRDFMMAIYEAQTAKYGDGSWTVIVTISANGNYWTSGPVKLQADSASEAAAEADAMVRDLAKILAGAT